MTTDEARAEARSQDFCERCHCCSAMWEQVPCWMCGGFCGPEVDDEDDDGWCPECQGEGEIGIKVCLGSCDENGKHKPKADAERREKERRG